MMDKKIKVLLLTGGESAEHEVSLASARSLLKALPEKFEVTPLVITKEGRWLPSNETQKALDIGSAATGGDLILKSIAKTDEFDVVFPLLHGPNGEDGSIQGLLQLAQVPFVGSGVLGSAVSMDKVMMKTILGAHNLPQVDYQLITRNDWRNKTNEIESNLEVLGFPLFIKPANLGSSLGISKVKDKNELKNAIDLALQFDRRIIAEAFCPGRELEMAVLGNDDPQTSPLGELIHQGEFYDYQNKYTEGLTKIQIPADVPDFLTKIAQELAIKAFKALDCAGLARIDFFYLENEQKLLINEVNTMPGFTTTSMYPKLWQAAGLSYSQLVEKLIELALEKR